MANKKEDKKKDAKSKASKPKKDTGADAPKKKSKGTRGKGAANAVAVADAGETKITPAGVPRLEKEYKERIAPALKEKLGLNAMQIPRIEKIVLNCCVKEAVANPKVLDFALNDIAAISGQKPILTRAKKAIATFKLRKGIGLGASVTLRRARMHEFLDRLINVSLPRVRDFRGISSKAFDGRGNYSLGMKEQIIFPEVNYEKVDSVRGLSVTICTSAKTNEHARELLTELGMPFRK